MKYISIFVLATVVVCFHSFAQGQESTSLVLLQTIALPNVQGGFNHMSVDAEHRRLFAAAPTNKTLEIVNLSTGMPLRSLEGEKPAAARYAPEFNQLYVRVDRACTFMMGKRSIWSPAFPYQVQEPERC